MQQLKDLIMGANNVYRTRSYVVIQNLGIKYNKEENSVVYSHDTYIKRTKALDKEYETIFKDKKHINGKRMHSAMFTRLYIK